jgi:hypothetical protein
MLWLKNNGRGERIRTFDPLVPNQMRYQAALRPDIQYSNRLRTGPRPIQRNYFLPLNFRTKSHDVPHNTDTALAKTWRTVSTC